jgi:uncharacterized protein YecE (DUF72 family)
MPPPPDVLPGQLALFGPRAGQAGSAAAPPQRPQSVDWRAIDLLTAPEAPDELIALGEAVAGLPARVYLGTSSWTFPGWAGRVYNPRAAKSPALEKRLAAWGLGAYARYPLFQTVGVDRTFYGPVSIEQWQTYTAQVPETFRFLVKAPELGVTARLPRHPRYGVLSGEASPYFLDAAWLHETWLGPTLEGLGDKAGPLLLQFPPQGLAALGGVGGFAAALDRLFSAWPKGPRYAVELRTPALLDAPVFDVLSAHRVALCPTVHPTMPPVREQVARARAAGTTDRAPFAVARWMLGGDLAYDDAKEKYAPFDRLADPDDTARDQLAEYALSQVAAFKPVWIIANNKAEGCSPASIERVARAIVDKARTGTVRP